MQVTVVRNPHECLHTMSEATLMHKVYTLYSDEQRKEQTPESQSPLVPAEGRQFSQEVPSYGPSGPQKWMKKVKENMPISI